MQATLQLYGLVFLLGSLTVAALSDLRRMAAQKDFAEVWGVFAIALLAYDVYNYTEESSMMLGVKWILITGFVFITLKHHSLNISLMDVAAVVAVASLLDAWTIILFYFIILVSRALLSPILSKLGEGGASPFLPVVFVSTIAVMTYSLYGGLIVFA